MGLRIENLLSAPLYLSPQKVGDRTYFISNTSGQLSLWAMDSGGSVPEPLLPPDIALFNPSLIDGEAFVALPDLGVIVLMVDNAGDENQQPHVVPIDGGDPMPLFGDRFDGQQVSLVELTPDGRGTISVDPRTRPENETYEIDVAARTCESLGAARYGNVPVGHDADRSRYLMIDGYTSGDISLWLWERDTGERRLLAGVPLEDRQPGQEVPLTGFGHAWFTEDGDTVVIETTRFDDLGGLGRFRLDDPEGLEPIEVTGIAHGDSGALDVAAQWEGMRHVADDWFVVSYNVDGVSWGYAARLDSAGRRLELDRVLWGRDGLGGGVVQHHAVDPVSGDLALSFSSATAPSQLVTVDGSGRAVTTTRNRVLGVPIESMAPGEDASYESHDGLRVSARLYLPADGLDFTGPRPIVYYIHGGPQGQERPDFTWFSMPLIQYLTMHGFAVFVPNVRGSDGYGLEYMKRVDRDWGGLDRLDHVAAVEMLRSDPRVDADRIGVMGRSYGGYMTQMLVGRHPELWSAAVDMFGPYDLLVWLDRLPATWRTYFALAIGDPETDRDDLIARSPSTYLDNLACPMMVIQGAADPRVVKAESDDLVKRLTEAGKDIEYLVFPDEGHDLTRLSNKATCYTSITEYFTRYLRP